MTEESIKQKIIVSIDDDLQELNLIKEAVSPEYDLVFFDNKHEILIQLLKDPNLYVAIIISPSDSNLELLHNMHTCTKTNIIPVIVELNKHQNNEESDLYIRAGATYYFVKSSGKDSLRNIIHDAIDKRKKHLSEIGIHNIDTASDVMINAEFKFQRLEQCQSLANFFADACPNPNLASIGISEILINAVEHGNLDISYKEKTELQSNNQWVSEIERRLNLPENKNKYASVTFKKTKDYIELLVKDQGEGFDWKSLKSDEPSTNLTETHGRGILMAQNLAFDTLEYSGKGNEVHCIININSNSVKK